VADDGPGIAPEIRDKMFQPFVTHGKANGIGLGLSVVQSIVRQHGGRIGVARSGPDGTVFLIRLPQPRGVPRSNAEAVMDGYVSSRP
jgi:signal transduction histidine kinase